MLADVTSLLGNRGQRETGKLASTFVDASEKSLASCVLPPPSKSTFPAPPCGAITEISGALSSGRTTLTHAILARATAGGEFCAFVDSAGAFDPWSAAQSGVDLPHLLWVRANGRLEDAFKAADLILHGGGFGVIVLDLCEASTRDLNRIPLSYWYRFRRAVENTPGKFVVVSHVPLAKSCARLRLETQRESALWLGKRGQTTLSAAHCERETDILQAGKESGTDTKNAQSVPFLFNGIDFAVHSRKQQARLAG